MAFDKAGLRSLTQRWHLISFWIGLAGVFLVILNYLWTQHRSHLWAALPFLLLLACPLLHLFHHRSHGKDHGPRPHQEE